MAAGRQMAAVRCTAAPEAAKQPAAAATAPSLWPARRARQAAARGADAGRLAAALRRVAELEARCAELEADARARAAAQAAVAQAERAAPEQAAAVPELVERLALVAPILEADLKEVAAPPIAVGRRNVVCHNPSLPAAVVRGMTQRSLNRVQREARRAAPRRRTRRPVRPAATPHRRQPAARSAAEAAPQAWHVAGPRGRGARSAPPAAARRQATPPPLASGACWWPAEAEQAGRRDSSCDTVDAAAKAAGADPRGRDRSPGGLGTFPIRTAIVHDDVQEDGEDNAVVKGAEAFFIGDGAETCGDAVVDVADRDVVEESRGRRRTTAATTTNRPTDRPTNEEQ